MNLSGLDKQQKDVVTKVDGKYLVLACAGSGKTRCLTYRIAHLLEEKKASLLNILAVTFTNKAANEMKERISELVEANIKPMWIGTFHSICVKILVSNGKEIGIPANFTIVDEEDRIKEIKSICGPSLDNQDIYNISALISRCKDNMFSPEDALEKGEEIGVPKEIAEVYYEYQKRIEKMNSLDFDDLIYKTVILFKTKEFILKAYQNRFKYIIMDECQDSSPSTQRLVTLLSGKHNNLMLIGDIDQSIYGWRGADVLFSMEFAKQKDVEILKLENNYRSQANIVNASNAIISQNEGRIEKTSRIIRPSAHKIVYLQTYTPYEEAEFIAKSIDLLVKKENYKYSNIAVLYRTNNQARIVEDILIRNGIPSRIYGQLGFYERKEIKDVIAYIKVLINHKDLLSLKRIINEPKRGVGDTSIKKIVDYAIENSLSIVELINNLDKIPRLNKKTKESLENFKNVINHYSKFIDKVDHSRLIVDYLTDIGYIGSLKDEQIEVIQEFVQHIITWAKDTQKKEDPSEDKSLYRYIKELSILSSEDEGSNLNRVKLMSIHSSKGLEFPVVFLTGLEETIFPHYACNTPNAIEEERRLFYVAVTRAMDRLFITSNKERGGFGKTYKMQESRFIKEIPSEFLKRL